MLSKVAHSLIFATFMLLSRNVSAWSIAAHQNIPEDGFLFMEFQGTNQMRWAADFLKAKAGGRYSGNCYNIDYAANETRNDNTQCGAIGVERVGGDKPDYFFDSFWDTFLGFNWHFNDMGFFSNNFTSWYHFVNLLTENDNRNKLVTNIYNRYDGYSYNQSYGFPNIGIDYAISSLLNNSTMSVNLPNCTDSSCNEWRGISTIYRANPAIDYRQNGSTTPVSGGSGSKALEQTAGTNYNCFTDMMIIANCADQGADVDGITQIPNTNPGGGSFFSGNEDWVIYEPATNAATFYYNEMWLEGLSSKNHSLQTDAIVRRYYTVTAPELLYFTVVQHWAGDMTQILHVWATIGFNHSDYEGYAEETYGNRTIGVSMAYNYEDYIESQAYANTWQNRYSLPAGNIDRMLMEQAFRTYHIRNREGYDVMKNSDRQIWTNAAKWGIRNGTAVTALISEKAVMDLRKCRNRASCDNL